MSLLEQLQAASFKGASFLVMAATTTGGRKDVKHSYPNSNGQTIEDLGLSPRVFNLTAVITGVNYIQDRDRFLSAIESGGPGTLIHPFYGELSNYVARTYTLIEDLTLLGEARFSVVFEISDSDGPPVKSQNTLSLIESDNNAVIASITKDIEDVYNVTPSFSGNFNSAKGKLDSLVDKFNESTSVFQAAADKINEYNQEISVFTNKINSLVQNPLALANSITSLFNTVNSLYANVINTAAVLTGFFDFGDDDPEIVVTTAGLDERKTNNDVINATLQTASLSYAYFNTAQIDFETVDQIDTAANALENQYRKSVEMEGLSDNTKSALTDLRTDMQAFFNDQRVIARQVINVFTNETSARLLAFQYYEDSTEADQILELNNVKQDVTFIEGDVRILTS